MRLQHALQREAGRLLAPVWIPAAAGALRFVKGYRIEGQAELREQFRSIRRESTRPLLICANHLTLIDSFLVAWALAPSWRYALGFGLLPWNTPESQNFAATPWQRVLAYLAKCIPITRGGRREEIARVLARVRYLLARGELALLFPEGGRSRSGRVELDSAAWGVGRVVAAVPGCRVLCVYMRGRGQRGYTRLPADGERFHVELACLEPKSDYGGVRKSLDFSRQIVAQLALMERSYLDGRQ